MQKRTLGRGLEVSAISCWGGQVDLTIDEGWEQNVQWGCENLELAADLGCGIWQGHCGIMPEDSSDIGWERMVEGMAKMAKRGEEVGACLAI